MVLTQSKLGLRITTMDKKALVLEAVSETASFRIPEFHNYHKSLPLPPVTTIVGLAGAALGFDNEHGQEYFSERNIFIGINGVSKGHFTDVWKALSSKKNNRDTVIQKEYNYGNRYYFVFLSNEETINELQSAFQSPVYPTVMGSSDSLLKVVKINLIDEPDLIETYYVENCVLQGNYQESIQINLDNMQVGKTYKYTPFSAPRVYNLPIGFDFQENGVRKIRGKKEMTFVGMQVKSENHFDTLQFNEMNIPLFEHKP